MLSHMLAVTFGDHKYDAMTVCLCKHIMLQGSNPMMVFCFGNFKPKFLMTKFEVLLESWWTAERLLMYSCWTPSGPMAQCKVILFWASVSLIQKGLDL